MSKKTKKLLSQSMAAVLALSAFQPGLLSTARADNELALTPVFSENVAISNNGGSISVTDTEADNDVWTSKVLFDTGMDFEIGTEYKLAFELSGSNGVGELFLCRSDDLNDRYDETFTAEEGSRSITFTADDSKVYLGMQVGNLGGQTASVQNLSIEERSKSAIPALLMTANCDVTIENGVITATDTSDNNDVWNSKLLYDAGVELEIGKSYEIKTTLLGGNGVGEFFVCKSADVNDRYDSTFVNTAGEHALRFTAESRQLYIGVQFGNIGKGNSVSVGIQEVTEQDAVPAVPAAPADTAAGPEVSASNAAYQLSVEDGVLVVNATDLSSNNDVWNSTVLYKLALAEPLEAGRLYMITFDLSGEHGVGEVFLCKSANLDDRHQGAFFNANGMGTIVFTATGPDAYLGMQLGNIGEGNSVTAKVIALYPAEEAGPVGVKTAVNCTYEVQTQEPAPEFTETALTVTDTSGNNDVWNSQLVYFFGDVLEAGKQYIAKINLFGENGVGEFFFLKSADIGERYSFDNEAGDHTITFIAENNLLYAGMQFGNIGEGSSVTATVFDVFEKPFEQKSAENCTEELGRDSVTLTDTDDNGDVWNSKAVYDTGITLEPGKTYTVTFTLDGSNGVGEFFFLKFNDIDARYSYDNTPGEHTITFTAEGTDLFMGIQCGNIGNGNSVTISGITVAEQVEEAAALAEEAIPEEEAVIAEAISEEVTEEEAAAEETVSEEAAEEVPAAEETVSEEVTEEEEAVPEEVMEEPAAEEVSEEAAEQPTAVEEEMAE